MCTYYREMNMITIIYMFTLPRMYDIIDSLSGAIYFTKIDLKMSYHQIKIKEGNTWNIVFKAKGNL
jgi:hypothetical protein